MFLISTHNFSKKKISVDPYCLLLPHFLFLCTGSWLDRGGSCGQCNRPSALVRSWLNWPVSSPNLIMGLSLSTRFCPLEFRIYHSACLLSLRVLLFILFYRLTPYPTSKCGNVLENSILGPLLFFLYISSQLKISFPRALNTFCKSLARIFISLVQTSVLSC